jgi:prephenate dehydratase
MTFSIAHLGPAGTYAEQAALAYAHWWSSQMQQPEPHLVPYPSMAQTLYAVERAETDMAIVPIENSIEGSVTTTLDTLWQVDDLKICQALVQPIIHVLVTHTAKLTTLQTVYSHPQPLGQCQQWLAQHLPQVSLIPTHSTTEALNYVDADGTVAAIVSERAAKLYDLPILERSIQDYPDNCTRFLVVTRPQSNIAIPPIPNSPVFTSLAFSLRRNVPGSLVTPFQIFADRQINLSRIESRPSKRSLGDYVFFVDAEAALETEAMRSALILLKEHTEQLKVLGDYAILPLQS